MSADDIRMGGASVEIGATTDGLTKALAASSAQVKDYIDRMARLQSRMTQQQAGGDEVGVKASQKQISAYASKVRSLQSIETVSRRQIDLEKPMADQGGPGVKGLTSGLRASSRAMSELAMISGVQNEHLFKFGMLAHAASMAYERLGGALKGIGIGGGTVGIGMGLAAVGFLVYETVKKGLDEEIERTQKLTAANEELAKSYYKAQQVRRGLTTTPAGESMKASTEKAQSLYDAAEKALSDAKAEDAAAWDIWDKLLENPDVAARQDFSKMERETKIGILQRDFDQKQKDLEAQKAQNKIEQDTAMARRLGDAADELRIAQMTDPLERSIAQSDVDRSKATRDIGDPKQRGDTDKLILAEQKVKIAKDITSQLHNLLRPNELLKEYADYLGDAVDRKLLSGTDENRLLARRKAELMPATAQGGFNTAGMWGMGQTQIWDRMENHLRTIANAVVGTPGRQSGASFT